MLDCMKCMNGTQCRANAKYEITAPYHPHTTHIHVTWENFSPLSVDDAEPMDEAEETTT